MRFLLDLTFLIDDLVIRFQMLVFFRLLFSTLFLALRVQECINRHGCLGVCEIQ